MQAWIYIYPCMQALTFIASLRKGLRLTHGLLTDQTCHRMLRGRQCRILGRLPERSPRLASPQQLQDQRTTWSDLSATVGSRFRTPNQEFDNFKAPFASF